VHGVWADTRLRMLLTATPEYSQGFGQIEGHHQCGVGRWGWRMDMMWGWKEGQGESPHAAALSASLLNCQRQPTPSCCGHCLC
jgi:hypothetical protein